MARLTKTQLDDYKYVDEGTIADVDDGRTQCKSCGTVVGSKRYMRQVGKSGHYFCLHCSGRGGFENVRRYILVEALAKMGCLNGEECSSCWSCVAKRLL